MPEKKNYLVYSKSGVNRARQLRRQMTAVEKLLWGRLRSNRMGAHFRRQVPFGPYIVDFLCAKAKLVVELDGGQHNEDAQKVYDQERGDWLRTRGVTVLRFWNNEVIQNLRGVLDRVKQTADELKARGVTPAPRWVDSPQLKTDPHPPRFARRPPPFRGR